MTPLTPRETQMLEALKFAQAELKDHLGSVSGFMLIDNAIAAASRSPRVTVAAKPKECRRERDGRVCQAHCPCTERCCFCGWQQEKHKPERARRWVVEEVAPGSGPHMSKIKREVKPITRADIDRAGARAGATVWKNTTDFWSQLLRELGIEVED